jgi:hypothetical protein
MAQQGYNNPATQTDDSTVGTVSILNIANIQTQNSVDATASLSTSAATAIIDNSVKLYNGSAFVGTDQASATHWTTSSAEETFTYGSSSNLMGTTPATLSTATVATTGFGAAIAAQMASGALTVSHYFRGTNYGFTPIGLMQGYEIQVTHWNEGGIASFVAGTIIDVPGGQKPIETFRVGDQIVSFFHGRRYTDRVSGTRQGERIVIQVQTTEGEVVSTLDHRFYVGHGRYKTISTINPGETLYVFKNGIIRPTVLLSKKTVASDNAVQTQKVYSLEVGKYQNYFANGFIVHNGVVGNKTIAHVDWVGIRITYNPAVGNFFQFFTD